MSAPNWPGPNPYSNATPDPHVGEGGLLDTYNGANRYRDVPQGEGYMPREDDLAHDRQLTDAMRREEPVVQEQATTEAAWSDYNPDPQ
jgi:hypothetical protein